MSDETLTRPKVYAGLTLDSAGRLKEIAGELRDGCTNVRRGIQTVGMRMREACDQALANGKLLREAQELAGPRKFKPWLAVELPDLARATVYNWMKLSVQHVGQIDTTLRKAYLQCGIINEPEAEATQPPAPDAPDAPEDDEETFDEPEPPHIPDAVPDAPRREPKPANVSSVETPAESATKAQCAEVSDEMRVAIEDLKVVISKLDDFEVEPETLEACAEELVKTAKLLRRLAKAATQ